MSYQGTGPTGISNYLCNTLLPSVTTLNIANIYPYEDLPKAGFPAATVHWSAKEARVADNSRFEHTFVFTVRVYIDRTAHNFGVSKAESILRSVGDELTRKIDSDPTLGGNCVITKPSPWQLGYVDQGSNNLRLVEIQLSCIDVNNWR